MVSDYLASLGFLGVFNVVLALAGALLAFGSINLMRDVTSHVDVMSTVVMMRRSGARWWDAILAGLHSAETIAIACAFITLTAGLMGQVAGTLTERWQTPFDTVLFAGILALLLANRRLPVVKLNKAPLSLCVTGLAWCVFFVSVR